MAVHTDNMVILSKGIKCMNMMFKRFFDAVSCQTGVNHLAVIQLIDGLPFNFIINGEEESQACNDTDHQEN